MQATEIKKVVTNETHPLHQKAVSLSKDFKRIEAELIDVLQKIDTQKLFRQMGYASLFEYVNRGLGLTEGVSYALINVARKSAAVPELRFAIQTGELSVSQAKRVTSVMTKDNAPELIEKAKSLSQRELEKEVARINPHPITKEKARYLTEDRIELKVNVSENTMKKLKRIQDLESQRMRGSRTLEQTLETIIELYLEKKDPIAKSEKILNKQSLRIEKTNSGKEPRTPIPAVVKHLVNKRDQGQCSYQDDQGRRCSNKRWLEVHHKVPVSKGGDNSIENLETLCFGHHRAIHELS